MEQNDNKKAIKAATSDKYTLNNWYTYGRGEDIILTEKATGKRVTVINKKGAFIKFPGIHKEGNWINELGEGSLEPYIHYRTEFDRIDDGRWIVLWCVQPDGRYWEDDDGFGGSRDDDIILYSYLASDGGFTQPFKVYRVGIHKYFDK